MKLIEHRGEVLLGYVPNNPKENHGLLGGRGIFEIIAIDN